MDKNTIIGFLLIGLLVLGFSWYNQPSPEQLANRQRYQDSIALVKAQEQRLEAIALSQDLTTETENISDSVRQTMLVKEYGAFASSASGKEEFITFENDLLELKISTKGGAISYAILKDYKSFYSLPLILFDE